MVVTRKLATSLAESVASASVDRLSELHVVPVDADLVRSAIALSRGSGISYWDAAIVRAAAVGGCERVLTEDLEDGRVLDGIRIVDPFLHPDG